MKFRHSLGTIRQLNRTLLVKGEMKEGISISFISKFLLKVGWCSILLVIGLLQKGPVKSEPTKSSKQMEVKRETEMERMKQSKFNKICVFCGSSSGKKSSYTEAATELGKELVW